LFNLASTLGDLAFDLLPGEKWLARRQNLLANPQQALAQGRARRFWRKRGTLKWFGHL
jgi:hypothetical protein